MYSLLEELLSTKREILLQKEKQIKLEFQLINSLKDKSIPFEERMKIYLELPKIAFEECAEYEELPVEIKYLVDAYNETEIIGEDQETEDLKFLLTRMALKKDGSFNDYFLSQNSISKNELMEAIEKIFEKGFVKTFLY